MTTTTITLSRWSHPTTGERRIYVNGSESLEHGDKCFFREMNSRGDCELVLNTENMFSRDLMIEMVIDEVKILNPEFDGFSWNTLVEMTK